MRPALGEAAQQRVEDRGGAGEKRYCFLHDGARRASPPGGQGQPSETLDCCGRGRPRSYSIFPVTFSFFQPHGVSTSAVPLYVPFDSVSVPFAPSTV